jgi:hypothetical protein
MNTGGIPMKDRTAPKGSYPSEYMFSGQGKDVRYIATGEFRNPRKGDWFLSGAIVQAYKAFADMTSPYWIAERDEESTAFRVGEQVTKDKFTVGSSTVPYVLTITALLWTDRGLLIRADLPDGKGTIEGPAKMFTAVATNAVAATPVSAMAGYDQARWAID